jgi:F0F1-type ATP synthase assembly protein I
MQGESESSAPQRGTEGSGTQQTGAVNRERKGRTKGERPPGSVGASAAIAALSRVFAVLGIMIFLGLLGAIIDRWLSTQFAMMIGIVIGTIIAVIGMIYAVKVVEIEQRQAKKRIEKEEFGEGVEGPVSYEGTRSIDDDRARGASEDLVKGGSERSQVRVVAPRIDSDSRP